MERDLDRNDAVAGYQEAKVELAKLRAERDALAVLLNRVLSCTDLRGWNGEKASLLCDDIDAVLNNNIL